VFDGIDYELKVGYQEFNSTFLDGSFYYDAAAARSSTFAQAFQHNWTIGPGPTSGGDMAFTATFMAVPEPSFPALFLTACGFYAGGRMRARRSRAKDLY
jgi:hypothetical protein